MRGIIVNSKLYQEVDAVLYEINVYDDTTFKGQVPLLRPNKILSESQKIELIKTAIDIIRNKNKNQYASESQLDSEVEDFEWNEELA